MENETKQPEQGRQGLPSVQADYQLSVIFPVWNQQETIRQAIQATAEVLATMASAYEIIVVDDDSTDATSALAHAAAEENPRVRLLRHGEHLGFGAAVRTGFQSATLELVVLTDGSGQFDPKEFEYVLPLARRYDVTCGYRLGRLGSVRRRFLSWGYNTLVNVLMGSPVRDVDCPCKVFHRAQLESILPESNSAFAGAEILTKARLQGLSIVEVGVHHRLHAVGAAKTPWSIIPKTLSSLLRFWWSRVLFRAPNHEATRFDARSWAALLVLSLVAGTLFFTNLSHPLFRPDESRYAEIGREMLVSGDWIVPMVEQGPYYDKPPLFYWLTAASFWFLGTTELAARLVPGLAAFLTVLTTFVFGCRIVGARAGFLSALALSLTTGFVHCGRFIILDSVFTLFIAMALFSVYEAIRDQRLRWSWWVFSAIACALALLTKGPAALVLIAPPVAIYTWLNRSSARPRLGHWIAYMGIAICLVAPWYVAVAYRDPEFAYHFFVKHHLHRFLTGEYHDNPIWYYVPVLLVGCLPWSLLLVPGLKFHFSRSADAGLLRPQALGFFLLWAGWCVLFFSLSRGKLPPYVLPSVPALAVLVGFYLDLVLSQSSLVSRFHEARSRVPRRAIITFAGAWLVIGSLGWLTYAIGTTEYLIESGVCLVFIVGVAAWGRKMPTKLAWATCAVVVAAAMFESAHELVPNWSRQRSPIAGSAELTELLQGGNTAVATYHQRQLALPFKLNVGHPPEFRSRPEDLKVYLGKQVRSLLVTKSTENVDSLQWALPSGMEIKQVLDEGMTRVFLIQAVPK